VLQLYEELSKLLPLKLDHKSKLLSKSINEDVLEASDIFAAISTGFEAEEVFEGVELLKIIVGGIESGL
jgi:hypothetical protein